MSEGFTFDSFGGKISVSRPTLYDWLQHEEFANTKAIGTLKSLLWWESIAKKHIVGNKETVFNNVIYVFSMKNIHNWVDKKEIGMQANLTLSKPIEEMKKLPVSELLEIAKLGPKK